MTFQWLWIQNIEWDFLGRKSRGMIMGVIMDFSVITFMLDARIADSHICHSSLFYISRVLIS